jgi:hypothetical protein
MLKNSLNMPILGTVKGLGYVGVQMAGRFDTQSIDCQK